MRSGVIRRSQKSGAGCMGLLSSGLALAAATAGIFPSVICGPAYAQDAVGVMELPPIVVTARRRSENDQGIPVSVTSIDDPGRRLSSTDSNGALARSAPNVNVVDTGGQSGNLFNIRGLGAFAPISADDTSAVVYIGEIPQSVFGIAPSLLDAQRVEVLRGPQGTLYGRNTQAGAINIVPNAPTFDREFTVRSELGTNGFGLGEIVANVPIIPERLAGRLALRYSTFGGDIPNLVAGGRDGAKDIAAARGTLFFAPNDATTATLTFNVDHNRDTNPRFLLLAAPGFPASAVDPRTLVTGRNFGANLKLEHEFSGAVLNTITSFQRNDSDQRIDLSDGLLFSKLTGLPYRTFNTAGADTQNIGFNEHLYMQEMRLSSLAGSEISWTGGVNFFRSEQRLDSSGHSGLPNYLFTNGSQSNRLVTNSYSAFGETVLPIANRLKLTLGARLGHEDKTASYTLSAMARLASFRFPGDPEVSPTPSLLAVLR